MSSGKLSIVFSRQEVTWEVQHFFQQPSTPGYFLQSPEFRFAGDLYRLLLFPNGLRGFTLFPPQFVDIELKHLSIPGVRRDVSCELRFISRTGNIITIFRRDTFDGRKVCSVPRGIFEQNRDPHFPDRPLTLIISMRLGEPSSAGWSKSEEAETPDRKEEQEGLPGVADLQSDYRQLLQKGLDSDACLVVSGKEFRAHRCVLRARSEVFDAMFRHETAEQANGRVVIEDLDPDCFVHFLEYLYTGVVGAGLSDDNVFGLYVAADKYGVLRLKSECVAHMRRTLSVDSFCDVVTLAQRHQEEDLLQRTILFFKANLQRIVTTPKWQLLVLDNGASVNELFTKAFPPGEQ